MNGTDNLQGICCAVTGGTGYVGSVLTRSLRQAGARVVEFRRKADGPGKDIRQFSLGETPAREAFDGVQVLIHCAYDFAAFGWKAIEEVNVRGTSRLLESAAAAGVNRFILISTISAFPGCRSQYGKAKMEMEAVADKFDSVILRPGLVYGKQLGGMIGSLAKLLSLPAFVPMLGNGNYVQYTAHEDDLAQLVCRLAGTTPSFERPPITAACETPYTLRQIMSMIAEMRGKHPHFIPVPAALIRSALVSLETLGLRPRMRSDSLVSLLHQNPAPDFSSLHRTGVVFREFQLSAAV